MSRALVVLDSEFQRRKAADWCWSLKDGTRVEFKAPQRSGDQNSKMWAMLTEVSVQLKWHGLKLTPDDWKLQFLDALRRAHGDQVRVVPNTDNSGFVNLGTSSSDLSKDEMSDLIELIFKFGAEHGVTFNDHQSSEAAPHSATDEGSGEASPSSAVAADLSSRTCTVDSCDKPILARGLCRAHYQRLQRHGDPSGGGTSTGEPERFYREVVLNYDGDDCLFWPYSTTGNGYAQIRLNGSQPIVSRLVCEEENGPPPTPGHEAAHSCGKGHLGCVARKHLSWKTRAENQADKVIHGTSNRGERSATAKLTEGQVRAIRESPGTLRELAAEFGISNQAVCDIKNGRSWGWLDSENEVTPMEEGEPAASEPVKLPDGQAAAPSSELSAIKRMVMQECIDNMLRDAMSSPVDDAKAKVETLRATFLEPQNLADYPDFVNRCAETVIRIVGKPAERERAKEYLSGRIPS